MRCVLANRALACLGIFIAFLVLVQWYDQLSSPFGFRFGQRVWVQNGGIHFVVGPSLRKGEVLRIRSLFGYFSVGYLPSVGLSPVGQIRLITAPLWLPALGILCLSSLWLWRRRRPSLPENCAACGYSLIGNLSGTCPECGMRREDRNGAVDETAVR